jgi:hypothetical protein
MPTFGGKSKQEQEIILTTSYDNEAKKEGANSRLGFSMPQIPLAESSCKLSQGKL